MSERAQQGGTDDEGRGERTSRRFPKSRISSSERERLVKEARSVTFPASVRGYERGAVDRYVQQVNRLIAELEISSSPESAVRHALAEVSEETREILQHAHETADEITARSRARADERLHEAEREAVQLRATATQEAEETRAAARQEADSLLDAARREAAELQEAAERESLELRAAAKHDAEEKRSAVRREVDEVVHAGEARARELEDSAQLLWRERRRLIEDMRAVAEQLLGVADAEARRFPRPTHDERPSLDEALRVRAAAEEPAAR
jgi:DivIVA domain-containing protein